MNYDYFTHQVVDQMRVASSQQEAVIYRLFVKNWKAQLDPELRKYLESVREKHLSQRKSFVEESNMQTQFDLDEYFQL